MSVIDARSFVYQIAFDSALNLKFRDCNSYEERMALASASGYQLSIEDIADFKKTLNDSFFSSRMEETACASWCPCTSQSC